jgi:O-antigen/teichoic acid export membrane protein
VQKSLTARVVILSFGNILQKSSTLIVMMFLVRLLNQDMYGSYQQVLYVAGISYGLFASGISAGIYYFVPRLEGEKRASFMFQVVVLMATLGAASALAVYLLGPQLALYFKNPALEPLLAYYAAYVFFWIGNDYFGPFLNASGRYVPSVLLGIFDAVTNAIFLLLPLWQGMPLAESLGILSIAAGIRYFAYLIITFRLVDANRNCLKFGMVREQLTYSIPLMASGWADLFGDYLDKIAVSLLYPPSVVAIYAIGTIPIPVWQMIAKPVNIVLRIKFSELIAAGRESEIGPIWAEAVRKQAILILPVVSLLWATADHVIQLMFTETYADSVWILRIALIDKFLFVMSFSVFPLCMGRSDVLFKGSIVYVAINAVLLLVFASPLGYYGPVAARVIAQYVTIAYYVFVILRQLRIPAHVFFPVATLTRIFAANLVSGVIAYVISQSLTTHFPAVVAATIAYGVVYFVFLKVLGVLRSEDIQTVMRFVSRRRQKAVDKASR